MPSSKLSLKAKAREAKSKPKSMPSKKVVNAGGGSSLSTEFIQDSDMEEDSALISDSDEDSLSNTTKSATNGKLPPPSGSSSSSDNETESDDESRSEDDATPEPAPTPEKSMKIIKPTQRASEDFSEKIPYVAPLPYKAPKDFEPVSTKGASRISRKFSRSHLEGKQIWYFTAPALVPISSIQQISLCVVDNGKVILSNEDGDYGLIQDSVEDKTYSKIMVPQGSESEYCAVARPLDRILHLQQIVKLPGVHDSAGYTTQFNPKATVPAKQPVRQQPKGLRMRFRPVGFGTGAACDVGSNSESANEDSTAYSSEEEMPKVFRKPPIIDSDDQSSSESDVGMTEAPPPPLPVVKAVFKKLDQTSTLAETRSKKSQKREHDKDDARKSKNRSSTSNIDTDDREPKKLKRKRAEPRPYTTER